MHAITVGIIPARYASVRFPGKVLAKIGGKPMIQHVYERALQARHLARLIVATDDPRVARTVEEFGGEVQLTREDHASGSDRAGEVAAGLEADYVVNIQGDEPFISPAAIDLAIETLQARPDAMVATLIQRCKQVEQLVSPNTAKVVIDETHNALYFSRAPIPHLRDVAQPEEWLERHPFYLHIGLYVFRREFLLDYVTWPPGKLEQAEKLEQLRILEHGYRIVCAETRYTSICVDTPEDLALAQKIWKERGFAEKR
ncbi:MAG: 3-deoxy-manno-octulosonate cytidylyltransferase [Calditrichaeota bacterium]|nr:MAG: 3-deoxy-manno-octulosonate cytidylyltransferase [Calditrichota bacterium]